MRNRWSKIPPRQWFILCRVRAAPVPIELLLGSYGVPATTVSEDIGCLVDRGLCRIAPDWTLHPTLTPVTP